MGPNLLLAFISALLASGPFISQIEFINNFFHYHPNHFVGGGFQVFVVFVGFLVSVLLSSICSSRKKMGRLISP